MDTFLLPTRNERGAPPEIQQQENPLSSNFFRFIGGSAARAHSYYLFLNFQRNKIFHEFPVEFFGREVALGKGKSMQYC